MKSTNLYDPKYCSTTVLYDAHLLPGISRHTIVCRVAKYTTGTQQTSVYFTGTRKMPFSRICSSIVPDQKLTIFAVVIPSGWGTSGFKFELNPSSHY